jgi:hypothetical protein
LRPVQPFSLQRLGPPLMRALRLCEIVEELSHARVLRPHARALVELPALDFHRARLLPHGIESQWPHEPRRSPMHEVAHVLASNERDVFAEATSVELEKARAVRRFLLAHSVEHGCRARERRAKSLGVVRVDPLVLLLERDRQREDLLLR